VSYKPISAGHQYVFYVITCHVKCFIGVGHFNKVLLTTYVLTLLQMLDNSVTQGDSSAKRAFTDSYSLTTASTCTIILTFVSEMPVCRMNARL
jgi:hypothetical protein